jgi:hypothetical protein
MVSRLTYSSTLKMEAANSSESSVGFRHDTWRFIPDDRNVSDVGSSEIDKVLSYRLEIRSARL